jgi:hypothetical protein
MFHMKHFPPGDSGPATAARRQRPGLFAALSKIPMARTFPGQFVRSGPPSAAESTGNLRRSANLPAKISAGFAREVIARGGKNVGKIAGASVRARHAARELSTVVK